MSNQHDDREYTNLLRQRAEDALRGKSVDFDGLPIEDIEKIVQELQVHQVELTLQNEELRRVQWELEISRNQYSQLYDFAPVGYCTLSQKGIILKANQTLAALLAVQQEELIHKKLSQFISRDHQDQFYLHCKQALSTKQRLIDKIVMVKRNNEKMDVRLESITAPGEAGNLWIMLSDITEQQQKEHAAQEAALLREIQVRLAVQREKERQKLALDLHDGPIQGLIATTYTLHAILSDYPDLELTPRLEALQEDIKKQISNLRSHSLDLRPPLISRFGLEQTIRSHAGIFQEKHPYISIQIEAHQTGPILDETTGLPLFRIYQEAMNNIAKHVQRPNTQVKILFDKDDQQVRLQIKDNGEGFDLPEQLSDLIYKGHLGLVGMRERAELLGGTLEIRSQKGEGTHLIVTVPLKQAGKAA